MQYFLNALYTKTGMSQVLLPDMELLKKMFPKKLNIKNANRVQKNFFSNYYERLTNSNISLAIKCGKDN